MTAPIVALFGNALARQYHRAAIARNGDFSTTLERLEKSWPEFSACGSSQQAPIFIFAAGWRSGSTLLQRMVSGGANVLLWGEPYANCHLVDSMCRQFEAFDETWPRREWFVKENSGDVANKWVANLYPRPEQLKMAHRAFFTEMFAQVARGQEISRWGFKEVRLGIGHARYLRWLFPNAKFLFLVRNPWNAFASYKGIGMRSYQRWPDKPVFTPWAFGRMWRSLAPAMEHDAQSLGGLCLRFENLCADATIREVSDYLNFDIASPRTLARIGSTSNPKLGKFESAMLTGALAGSAARLGYVPHPQSAIASYETTDA